MNEMAEIKDIESKIYNIRGVEVMLDSDLAKQYQCANGTKSINLAVKRNIERFPSDFYFQLNEEEFNKSSSCSKKELLCVILWFAGIYFISFLSKLFEII